MQCDINHYSVLLDNTTEVPGADFLCLFSDSMQLSERQAFCLSVGKYLSTSKARTRPFLTARVEICELLSFCKSIIAAEIRNLELYWISPMSKMC